MAPELRTRSIGTKVTDAEFEDLQKIAGPVRMSEWVRGVLLEQKSIAGMVDDLPRATPQIPEPVPPPPTPPPPPPPPPRGSDPGVQVHDIMRAPVERKDNRASKRWPSARPLGSMMAVVVAVLATWGAWHVQVNYRWTAEQRERWPAYVKSGVYAELGLPPASYAFLKAGRYEHGTVHDYLRQEVYDGRTVLGVWRDPATVGFLVLAIGLVIGGGRDWRARELRRVGRVVKGPELVDARAFRRVVHGDGLAVEQRRGPAVAIPRQAEPMHISVSGGPGSGKSTLFSQWLPQIETRGETAVVYDPHGEYTRQFFNESRGDVILNPFDGRFRGWAIGEEVEVESEAFAVAAALFTAKRGGTDTEDFFRRTPREIFAHLISRTPRPTAAELVHWLANPDLLNGILGQTEQGRSFLATIAKQAVHQTAGILAELNNVGRALACLPPESPDSWSAARWSRDRRGWLFVTSDPTVKDRIAPLMTLWLDLVMLRCMQAKGPRRTWLVIDELASIGRLPQLPGALAQARKFDVAIVLGFQSTSQLQTIYGDEWRSMLSAPKTHIVLRTTEPECAKWEEALIGTVVRERMKETQQKAGRKWSRSETIERTTEPLVMASQIGGLRDFEGFLKHEDHVVPIRFAYGRRESRVPAFVAR